MNYPILQSLAYLRISSEDDNQRIFLDNFIPFVVDALKQHGDDLLNLQLIQDIVKGNFGIKIPQNVIKGILHRSRRDGYVTYRNSNYYKNNKKINAFTLTPLKSRVERIYSALLTSLIVFAKEKYQATISELEAESLLLSFISYYQIDFYERETVDRRLLEESERIDKNKRYIVASFILNAKKQDPTIYEYIDVIVKGFMITQVLYLPDAHETKKRFTKTKVFLDTSFIIYALGYSGLEFKNSSTELLDLLYKNNATLCCFEHTVEEIEGILLACSGKLGTASDGRFGRTLRYFQSIGATCFDIKLKISHLRNNIQNLNIKIVDIPKYADEQYVAGETELFDLLVKKMVKKVNEEAIRKDVASVSAIYRYRQGNLTNYVENTTALFVTTSSTLALTSNNYFFRYNDKSLAPPCVTDYFLTNLLWLKSPSQAPDLPMKRIIADAYAAIQPNDSVMEKWQSEVSRIKQGESVTEEDFYFMRSSEEVYTSLMEYTLGDARKITGDKVGIIVQNAKNIIRQQVEESFKPELIGNQQSILELKQQLDSNELEKIIKAEKRKHNAHKIAKFTTGVIQWVIFVVLILAIALTLSTQTIFGLDLSVFLGANLSLFLKITSMVSFVIFTVLTNYFGLPIPILLRPFEVWLENWLYRMFELISNKL